jgi:hypothetical protein
VYNEDAMVFEFEVCAKKLSLVWVWFGDYYAQIGSSSTKYAQRPLSRK